MNLPQVFDSVTVIHLALHGYFELYWVCFYAEALSTEGKTEVNYLHDNWQVDYMDGEMLEAYGIHQLGLVHDKEVEEMRVEVGAGLADSKEVVEEHKRRACAVEQVEQMA